MCSGGHRSQRQEQCEGKEEPHRHGLGRMHGVVGLPVQLLSIPITPYSFVVKKLRDSMPRLLGGTFTSCRRYRRSRSRLVAAQEVSDNVLAQPDIAP
jgi:hypothetical protein